MPFLIDGHNVIAALPDINLEDPDDEAKLVVKLRAWSGRGRRKAIVVFDGGIPGGPSRVLSSPEVRVVFAARPHSTADRIIKERLGALPDAPNWTVVASDREVLDNARMVAGKRKPMWVRTPVIPGYTDTEENVRQIARFIRDELPGVERYDLLAFNNTCDAKYRRLDMLFPLAGEGLLAEEKMITLAEAAEEEGLTVARWSGATARADKGG